MSRLVPFRSRIAGPLPFIFTQRRKGTKGHTALLRAFVPLRETTLNPAFAGKFGS